MDFGLISYFYKKIIIAENAHMARINMVLQAKVVLQVVEKYDKSLL